MCLFRSVIWTTITGFYAVLALPALAQETCADYPELSSCNTTPVGVCDATAAANFVLDKGGNQWVVLPADDDPSYPGECSYEDDFDPINPKKITAKDDTNNLQCALDFAAANRSSADMSATITLKKGRYCVRSSLVGLDFSGTIEGAGRDKTTLDFDNPALKDADGHLTGEGGFRHYWDVEKSVIDSNGDAIDLFDRVEFFGDEPALTKSRRYFENTVGGLALANNRFNRRELEIRDLQLNASKGTRTYSETIHGYTNILARPLSLSAFVTDTTEFGGRTISLGGRSNELEFNDCAVRAQGATNNNTGQPWYEQETGVDLTALDEQLCIVPINDPAQMESPINPRNCDQESCSAYAYDLANLPEIDTRFIRIKATGRGNMNNGLYYLNAERNLTIDTVVSGDEVLSLNQPVHLNLTVKHSALRGLGSVFVGSMFDFGDTPIVDGKVNIKNNRMKVFREGEETYSCGRLWERLSLSGTAFNFLGNIVNGCQGTFVRHGYVAYYDRRGIDGADSISHSLKPIPDPSILLIKGNVYKQGPVLPGAEDIVASFFAAVDWLNNAGVESTVGVPLPTLEVRIVNNEIITAEYSSEEIRPFFTIPISLEGMANAKIRGNSISGTSATAIGIGQYPEELGSYDVGTRIINNDLSGFNVVQCTIHVFYTTSCSTGTAALDAASLAKLWLGPGSSGIKVVRPESDPYVVGDLTDGATRNIVR